MGTIFEIERKKVEESISGVEIEESSVCFTLLNLEYFHTQAAVNVKSRDMIYPSIPRPIGETTVHHASLHRNSTTSHVSKVPMNTSSRDRQKLSVMGAVSGNVGCIHPTNTGVESSMSSVWLPPHRSMAEVLMS